MAQNSKWATVEGGLSNTFPLSINRESYWTTLRKGECFAQDMTTRDYRGILSFSPKPNRSPEFFIKDFAKKEQISDTTKETEGVFHWGRWWRIDPDNPANLDYSKLGLSGPPANWSDVYPKGDSKRELDSYIERQNELVGQIKGPSAPRTYQEKLTVYGTLAGTSSTGAPVAQWKDAQGNQISGPEEYFTDTLGFYERRNLIKYNYAPLYANQGFSETMTYWVYAGSDAAFRTEGEAITAGTVVYDNSDIYKALASLDEENADILKRYPNYVIKDGERAKAQNPPAAESAYVDFIDDSSDPIRLIAFNGVGSIYILKNTCGYVITNAHYGPTEWRKSAPNYSIGTEYGGSGVTNAIIDGAIATAFRDRSQPGLPPRHYLWNGQDFGLEMTGNVRKLATTSATYAEINWPQRLVIFGPLVYELDEKHIFYYSGATTASVTTRPYFTLNYTPQTVQRLAFVCDGNSGSFDATIEYGQSFDNLQTTRTYKLRINTNSKNRFRHVWVLDMPVVCRVWRIKIENLAGVGITQIDADVSFADSPDDADGTE